MKLIASFFFLFVFNGIACAPNRFSDQGIGLFISHRFFSDFSNNFFLKIMHNNRNCIFLCVENIADNTLIGLYDFDYVFNFIFIRNIHIRNIIFF